MKVQLGSPVVVRMAGMPFERLSGLSGRDQLWALLDCPDFLGCLVTINPALGLQLLHGSQAYRLVSSMICLGNVRNLGVDSRVLREWSGCYSIPNFRGHGEVKLYPELRLGELVLARWMVELSLASLVHLLPEGQLVSLFGMPRFVFVKINQAKSQGTAQLSPFRPGQSDLWLELSEGKFTSELRFNAWADGPDFAQQSGLHFALKP